MQNWNHIPHQQSYCYSKEWKNQTKNDKKLLFWFVTFSVTLLDLRHKINKNWHILQTESKLKEFFKIPLLLPLKGRNFSIALLELITFRATKKKKQLTHAKTFGKGKYHHRLTRTINFCCNQIISTSYVQSAITQKTFEARHVFTCKSNWVTYSHYIVKSK